MKIWYLEMRSVEALRPARPIDGFASQRLQPPDPDFNARMYAEVGGPWQWTDKQAWSWQDWHDYLQQPGRSTWKGLLHDRLVGYFELYQENHDVEIGYFGLLPEAIGRGLGGAFLEHVLRVAWTGSVHRVWVHTCSHDHPLALANYQARGLQIYRIEERE